MDKETYDEIVSVSYDFEYSLEQEKQNRIDQEHEGERPPSATGESDDENQSGVSENRSVDEVNYIEKRSRKGKGTIISTRIFCLC